MQYDYYIIDHTQYVTSWEREFNWSSLTSLWDLRYVDTSKSRNMVWKIVYYITQSTQKASETTKKNLENAM